MADYIYLPVPTNEMADLASDIADAAHRASGNRPGVLRNHFSKGILKAVDRKVRGGCLRMVVNPDVLYFLVHGTGQSGSRVVGANRNHGVDGAAANYKKYTPNEVAVLLENEGLPKTFKDLRLLCCGAGLEGDPATHEELSRSFAGRVFDALKARGYNRIRVTGYTGNVRAGAGDGIRVDVKDGDIGNARKIVDPDEAMVVYE